MDNEPEVKAAMIGYPANRAIVPAAKTARQPILAIPLDVNIVPPPYGSALFSIFVEGVIGRSEQR